MRPFSWLLASLACIGSLCALVVRAALPVSVSLPLEPWLRPHPVRTLLRSVARVAKSVPTGSVQLMGLSQVHKCPCHGHVWYRGQGKVDFVVVRAGVRREGQVDLVEEASIRGVGGREGGGGDVVVDEEGEFQVVVSGGGGAGEKEKGGGEEEEEEEEEVLLVGFERQLETCPVVLPARVGDISVESKWAVAGEEIMSKEVEESGEAEEDGGGDGEVVRQGELELEPRIVGGNVPDSSLRRHMVSLLKDNTFVCSGSLLSPRWVVTAAHCSITTAFHVRIGGENVVDGVPISINQVIRHPSYQLGRDDSPYDIAVIELVDEAPSSASFVLVNTNDSVPLPGAYSRVMGYGRTQERQGLPQLRQVDVPIVAMQRCKNNYGGSSVAMSNSLNEELQLCAGRVEGGCDACQGDSGGPLLLFDKEGQLVQVGIVSFGIGCAKPDFPGVYTKLSRFSDWMESNGVKFFDSKTGTSIFSDGSAAASSSSSTFTLFGLTPIQSIIVIACAAVVGVALLSLLVLPFMRKSSRRRRRRRRRDESSLEGSDSQHGSESFSEYPPGMSPYLGGYHPQAPPAGSLGSSPYGEYNGDHEGFPYTSDMGPPLPVIGSTSYRYEGNSGVHASARWTDDDGFAGGGARVSGTADVRQSLGENGDLGDPMGEMPATIFEGAEDGAVARMQDPRGAVGYPTNSELFHDDAVAYPRSEMPSTLYPLNSSARF